jgi:hypothetical protein
LYLLMSWAWLADIDLGDVILLCLFNLCLLYLSE